MRYYLSLITLVILILIFNAMPVFANLYIIDNIDCLTENDEKDLQSFYEHSKLSKKDENVFLYLTSENFSVIDRIIGNLGTSGILLYFNPKTDLIYIKSWHEIEDIISKDDCKQLQQPIKDYFNRKMFLGGCREFLYQVNERISGNKISKLAVILLFVLILITFTVISVFYTKRKLKINKE